MQDKQELIAEVRHLIGEAEIETAAQRLTAYLEAHSSDRALHDDTLEALAQFRRTQRDRAKGLITDDQARQAFARVNEQLLQVLSRLDQREATAVRRRWGWALLSVAIIALGGLAYAVIGWLAFEPADLCPDPPFNADEPFRALLLPYRDYTASGAPDLEIPVSLQAYFRQVGGPDLETRLDIRVMDPHPWLVDNPNRFPPTDSLASDLAGTCLANLIVWGTRENRAEGGYLVRTSYQFLGFGDRFAFDKVKYRATSQLDTVHALSTISTRGVITESLEASIRVLYGIMSQRANDPEAAIRSLRQVYTTDSATVLTKEMFLANSYITTQQYDSAAVAYDRILAVHEEYGFALENRANLYMLEGRFPEAIDMLTTRLEAEPPNTPELLRLRGLAYLRASMPNEALEDLQRAREDLPEDPSIPNLIEEARGL